MKVYDENKQRERDEKRWREKNKKLKKNQA